MNYILMLVSPIFLHRELVVAIATNGAAAAFGGSIADRTPGRVQVS